MSSRYTKARRLKIVREFMGRHRGQFHAGAFLEEASDPAHPAHGWFDWDDAHAAHRYRLWQANHFISGLRISLEVKDPETRVVSVVTAPVGVASPGGGGYESMECSRLAPALLRSEAARTLKRWLERYAAVLVMEGIDSAPLEVVARRLSE